MRKTAIILAATAFTIASGTGAFARGGGGGGHNGHSGHGGHGGHSMNYGGSPAANAINANAGVRVVSPHAGAINGATSVRVVSPYGNAVGNPSQPGGVRTYNPQVSSPFHAVGPVRVPPQGGKPAPGRHPHNHGGGHSNGGFAFAASGVALEDCEWVKARRGWRKICD